MQDYFCHTLVNINIDAFSRNSLDIVVSSELFLFFCRRVWIVLFWWIWSSTLLNSLELALITVSWKSVDNSWKSLNNSWGRFAPFSPVNEFVKFAMFTFALHLRSAWYNWLAQLEVYDKSATLSGIHCTYEGLFVLFTPDVALVGFNVFWFGLLASITINSGSRIPRIVQQCVVCVVSKTE
jgi:hypothetical protein